MEEIAKETSKGSLFNSPLEIGVRSVIILEANHPYFFNLILLTWFDHLIVHTGDIEGPVSLHPALPHRSGELLVRRRLVEQGITLMRRLHLIDMETSKNILSMEKSEEVRRGDLGLGNILVKPRKPWRNGRRRCP